MTALDEESLLAAELARRMAIAANDVATLDAMTADSFYYAHISGFVEDRAQYFARLHDDPLGLNVSATHSHELRVQMRTGYALLSGKSHIESSAGIFDTLFLSVWEPGEHGWLISAYASTPMEVGS